MEEGGRRGKGRKKRRMDGRKRDGLMNVGYCEAVMAAMRPMRQ